MPRQTEVEQDHVGAPRGGLSKGVLPTPDRVDVEVVIPQAGAQGALHLHLVIHHENPPAQSSLSPWAGGCAGSWLRQARRPEGGRPPSKGGLG